MTAGARAGHRSLLIAGTLMTSGRVRFLIAFALFAGWMGWLGYAALTKTRAPVVSRAQVAGMLGDRGAAVVASVREDADGKPAKQVAVTKRLTAGGEKLPDEFEVGNLPDAPGFEGTGEYLLLITQARGGEFRVVGRQPSPGYSEPPATSKPMIYRWSPGVEAQARNLLP